MEHTETEPMHTLNTQDVDYKTLHEYLRHSSPKSDFRSEYGEQLMRRFGSAFEGSRRGKLGVTVRGDKWCFSLRLRRLTEEDIEHILQTASGYLKHREKTETFHGLFGQPLSIADPKRDTVPANSIKHHQFIRGKRKRDRAVFGVTYGDRLVTLDIGTSPFTGLTLDSEGHSRVANGLFGTEIGSEGQTSLFDVNGVASCKTARKDLPFAIKFTVKRLPKYASWDSFYDDYSSLRLRQSLQHPHIADILSAFVESEFSGPRLMIAFPQALGTLEQLLVGTFDEMELVSLGRSFLWSQFVGLSSALAYYHEISQTLVNTRAFDILVYVDDTSGQMVLKFTNFGIIRVESFMDKDGRVKGDFLQNLLAEEGETAVKARLVLFLQRLFLRDIQHLCKILVQLSIFIVDGRERILQLGDFFSKDSDNPNEFVDIEDENCLLWDPTYLTEHRKQTLADIIQVLSLKNQYIARIRHVLLDMLEGKGARLDARSVCQSMVKFYIIKTGQDQVLLGELCLPNDGKKANETEEYEHSIHPPDDIQKKLVAAQIVSGLRYPDSVRGQAEMISMLPKKKIPPDFNKTMRTMGWGIHAEMGFSAKKILWWLLFSFMFLILSAAPWLIWVDRFDLQNAFVPGGTILTVLMTCVAIAQAVG
ncbi:hypothetical protein CGCF245_v002279 [Colletotrichum fructicola]|nr:hypothetical protein CGCF245_v002279 [Colletotrichum fructicola]